MNLPTSHGVGSATTVVVGMFYSPYLLSRKGPLGTIWVAAHLQRKLKKAQVIETSISNSVDCILEVHVALRITGYLLLGVTRIYSKKVDYLYNDCNETLHKIKSTSTTFKVALPEQTATAPFFGITIPETFELDAWRLGEVEGVADELPDQHTRNREQISLNDEGELHDNASIHQEHHLGSMGFPFFSDDRFPSFRQQETPRDHSAKACALSNYNIGGRNFQEDEVLGDQLFMTEDDAHTCSTTEFRSSSGALETQSYESNTKLRREIFPENAELSAKLSSMQESMLQPIESISDACDRGEEARVCKETGLEQLKVTVESRHNGSISEELRGNPIEDAELDHKQDTSAQKSPSCGHDVVKDSGSLTPLGLTTPVKHERKRKAGNRRSRYDKVIVLSNEEMRSRLDRTDDIVRKRRRIPFSASKISWEYTLSQPCVPCLPAVLRKHFLEDELSQKKAKLAELGRGLDAVAPMWDHTPAEEEQSLASAEKRKAESSLMHKKPRRLILDPCEKVVDEVMCDVSAQEGTCSTADKGSSILHLDEAPASSTKTTDVQPGLMSYKLESGTDMGGLNKPSVEAAETSTGRHSVVTLDLLEEDADSVDSQVDQKNHWSPFTWKVARYIYRFKQTESSTRQPDGLKLSCMLEGKIRKECARCFSEILTLRSGGFIDTKQDSPYSDITILTTPKLYSLHF